MPHRFDSNHSLAIRRRAVLTAVGVLCCLGPGCGGSRTRGESGVSAEDATYYRDQARQIFGTDLVRVEPLREPNITQEEYATLRRQLDLRVIASNAPRPGPVLADRRISARDWESDRPARSELAGPRAAGSVPNASVGWEPAAGEEALVVEAVRPPKRADGEKLTPWEVETGRERRALARAGLLPPEEAAASSADAGEFVPTAGQDGSRLRSGLDIDPAFEELVASTADSMERVPWASGEGVDEGQSGAGGEGGRVAGARAGGAGGVSGAWTIVIAVFRNEGAGAAASEALAQVQTEGRLPDAFIQERGEAIAICYGAFEDEQNQATQAELRRVKSLEVGGTKPYAATYLAPPLEIGNKVKSEYDLRTVRRVFGKDALYTLQVGVYGREDVPQLSAEERKTVQEAAEQAAADLRRQGELAFFYHGRHRSVVTVGVFGPDDFNPLSPGTESRRLREVRRRHPLNLYNGQGYTGKTPGMREAKLVPSALVAVPEK